MKKKGGGKACYRNVGDCIEGDAIRVVSQRQDKWKILQKSSQHKGRSCVVRKDAKATILKTYTNLQK
jgi:hypothetical protein